MICSSINDRNLVDDSVKAIIETVPNIVRTAYAIFEKYGKLKTVEIAYNTFRGSRNLNARNIHVSEYLFVLEKS